MNAGVENYYMRRFVTEAMREESAIDLDAFLIAKACSMAKEEGLTPVEGTQISWRRTDDDIIAKPAEWEVTVVQPCVHARSA